MEYYAVLKMNLNYMNLTNKQKANKYFCLGKKQIAKAHIKTLNVSKIIPYKVGQK